MLGVSTGFGTVPHRYGLAFILVFCVWECVCVPVHTVSVIPSVNNLLDSGSAAWSCVGSGSGLGFLCVVRVRVVRMRCEVTWACVCFGSEFLMCHVKLCPALCC